MSDDDYQRLIQAQGMNFTQQTGVINEEEAKRMADQAAKLYAEEQEKTLKVHGNYLMRMGYGVVSDPTTGVRRLEVVDTPFRFYQDGFVLFGSKTTTKVPQSVALGIYQHVQSLPVLGTQYTPTVNGEVVYALGQHKFKVPFGHPLEQLYASLSISK